MREKDKAVAYFVNTVVSGGVMHNLDLEGLRGCFDGIYSRPVNLEPRFEVFNAAETFVPSKDIKMSVPLGRVPKCFVTQVLFTLLETIEWITVEQALSCMSGFSHKFAFEMIGNCKEISYYLVLPEQSLLPSVEGVFQRIDPDIELSLVEEDPLRRIYKFDYNRLSVSEICFEGAYYHIFIDCKNRVTSPLQSVLRFLSAIPEGEFGGYQVLFESCNGAWHSNIKAALEAKATLKNKGTSSKSLAKELKDFATKQLFAVRPRLFSTGAPILLSGYMDEIIGDFQTEGRRVYYKNKDDLEKVITPKQIISMLNKRVSYMTGMIVSPAELSGFVHFPDRSIKKMNLPVKCYDGFKVPERLLGDGIPLGTSAIGGTVHIPASANNLNTYLIGGSGSGKTTAIIHRVLYHVERGDAVAVAEPHGHLIPEIISSERLRPFVDRVHLFDPCDDEYVLDYNPFDIENPADAARLAADYVDSAKTLFSTSWGYRMQHILMMLYYALFLTGKNLSSIPILLSKSSKGASLRREVIEKSASGEVRRFFDYEIMSYSPEAFSPILNKISALLLDPKLNRIFSTVKSKVKINDIVNNAGIFLISLPMSGLGAEISSQLGAMVLAQIQKAAFHRTDEERKKPLYLFVDECYRFNAFGVYESILNETRKFGLSLCLSHQDSGQISEDTLKTFLSAKNLMVFGVNFEDAKRLSRALDNRVKPEELVGLNVGEVVARIDNEIVKLRTFPPDDLRRSDEVRDLIISSNRKKYYTKLADIKTVATQKEKIYDSF